MKQKHIFALAIRVTGLWGMMKIVNHWSRQLHVHYTLLGPHSWELILEILLLALGVFMVVFARFIVRLMSDSDDNDDAKDNPKNKD